MSQKWAANGSISAVLVRDFGPGGGDTGEKCFTLTRKEIGGTIPAMYGGKKEIPAYRGWGSVVRRRPNRRFRFRGTQWNFLSGSLGGVMPPVDLTSPKAKGPIRDPNAERVCGLNGIAAAQQRLVTLRQLRGGLNTSISELEGEHSKEHFVNQAFLVARFTKATCDAFLGMASALAEAVLPKVVSEKAKAINSAYEAATPLAAAVGTKVAGGNVDYTKTLTSSAKGASSFIKNDGYQLLAQSTVVKVEIIKAAMNGDQKEVVNTAGSYLYDLHTTIAKMERMPERSKQAAALAEIAKRAFEYHKALGEAFDGMLDSEEEGDERYIQLRTTLLKQAKMVSAKIAELELYIQSSKPEAQQRSLP